MVIGRRGIVRIGSFEVVHARLARRACLGHGAWGDMFAGRACAIMSQASHGVNLVEGPLGPVGVLKADPAEDAVGAAFL